MKLDREGRNRVVLLATDPKTGKVGTCRAFFKGGVLVKVMPKRFFTPSST